MPKQVKFFRGHLGGKDQEITATGVHPIETLDGLINSWLDKLAVQSSNVRLTPVISGNDVLVLAEYHPSDPDFDIG